MLVNKERVQRTLLTLYGTIRFSRTILSPGDKQSAKKLLDEFGKKTVCPVDDALSISDIPCHCEGGDQSPVIQRCGLRAKNQVRRTDKHFHG